MGYCDIMSCMLCLLLMADSFWLPAQHVRAAESMAACVGGVSG